MENDGQHRDGGGAAVNNGQRQRRFDPRSHVGQTRGGDQQMDVHPSPIDSDISTTRHSGGPLSPGERGGSDDRR